MAQHYIFMSKLRDFSGGNCEYMWFSHHGLILEFFERNVILLDINKQQTHQYVAGRNQRPQIQVFKEEQLLCSFHQLQNFWVEAVMHTRQKYYLSHFTVCSLSPRFKPGLVGEGCCVPCYSSEVLWFQLILCAYTGQVILILRWWPIICQPVLPVGPCVTHLLA